MHTKLVSSNASEWLDNKLLACAWNVWQIWTITAICKGTQAIFCDRNAPKKDKWNSYSYIRDTLLMLGIPADQIAFIHDYDTDAKKVKLFEAINEGRIRIVFGSTSKLGTGVNMQTKLIALHHIDCPWRPSDLEQREGRGVRQGNEWSDVFIFRYVTEGRNNQAGFDSFLWQAIENKQRMISQVMSGDRTHRTIEDIDETVLNAAQMKAIASGDPLIMERATLEAELQGLGMQLQAYNDTQFRDKSKIQYLADMVNTNHPANIQHIQSDLTTVAKANLKLFISDRGVMLDKAVLIADHRGSYRIRVKTCKIGLKALPRGALRNQFRLIGSTTVRTEAMLKRSNGLLAMRTPIAKFPPTEKAKLSPDIHPHRISRIARSPARWTELKYRNRLNGSTTRNSL
jgi:hypothetical protein